MAEGRKGFFGRLVEGLAKTRSNIAVSYTHLDVYKRQSVEH